MKQQSFFARLSLRCPLWQRFQKQGRKQKGVVLLLLLIILFGGFVRFWHLGAVPFGRDEFLDINATYGFYKTGEWQAWDFIQDRPSSRINPESDDRAWVYRWQVAALFHFFPPTEAVARSVSAFWGTMTIALVFLVARVLTGSAWTSLAAAALWAVLPDAVIISRTLRMYAMFVPVFLLFWLVVWLALENDIGIRRSKLLSWVHEKLGINLLWLALAVPLGVLSLHLHLLTKNIFLFLALYIGARALRALPAIWREWNKGRNAASWWRAVQVYPPLLWGALGALAASAGVMFSPTLREKALAGVVFFENHYSYLEKVFGNYAHPLLAFLLLLLGIGALWREGRGRQALWLAVSFFGGILAAIFLWQRVAGMQYIFFLEPFGVILVASGAVFVLQRLLACGILGKHRERARIAAACLLLLLLPSWGYYLQENTTYHITSRAEQPNYRKVLGYVKKKLRKGDALITRDFRGYYLAGAHVPVYDLGGEREKQKLTLQRLQEILSRHKHGWVILSENDEKFVTKEARAFIQEHMERVSNSFVRGKISVYRWGGDENNGG